MKEAAELKLLKAELEEIGKELKEKETTLHHWATLRNWSGWDDEEMPKYEEMVTKHHNIYKECLNRFCEKKTLIRECENNIRMRG